MAQKAPGRVLVLCHQAEILKQNQKAFAEVSGGEASGIFCAGLGEKDLTKRVTFAHRDSLGNHLGNIGEWPLVIADECFVAGSLVDGIPIEQIKVGDYVTSFNEKTNQIEIQKVLAVSKKRIESNLYKVLVNGKQIICTADHPFFTRQGWVVASNLSTESFLLSQCDELQAVQKRSSKDYYGKMAKIFDSSLWILLLFARVQKYWKKFFLQESRKRVFNKNEEQKSYDKSRYFTQNERNIEKNRSQTTNSRGERQTDSFSCADNIRRNFRSWFCIGIPSKNFRKSRVWLPNFLQVRFSKCRIETGNRMRWCFSRKFESKNQRRQEGLSFNWLRVDSVEVQKQNDIAKQNRGHECDFVYNIQVEKNENYFVEGVLVHNCHLISSRTVSRYSQILEETNFRHLIGLTATPYRSSGGRIYGKGKTFDVCAYTVNIQTLIKQGYLSDYVVDIQTTLDTTGVAERGNDFDEASLSAKALQEKSLNDSAMAILQKTTDRKCTLIFCVGRKHAQEIAARLPACEYIDGETKQADRDTLLARMRAGQVKYCVNVGVLTTGTDIPCIDCVAMLRPTMSTSLYVQMVGRGLRKHHDKKNLLVLELTDNFERFGSLDDPMLFGSATEHEITETIGDTPPPLKACPECDFEVPNGTRECPHCGYLFIRARADYGNGEIVSLDVISSHHAPCRTKNGDDAIVVTFVTQVGVIKEWLNINHSNPWVAQTSQAKLRKLRQMPVEVIKVRGLNETYPRILSYHIDV
jgi:hypothetical protein